MTPICRVCGREGALTKEDIQPQWLRRFIVSWAEQQNSPLSGQLPVRHVIRICDSCNATMGSNLEQPASQVLPSYFLGQETEVHRQDHDLMAAWAAKAMLLATLNSHRPGHWGLQECQQALASVVRDGQPPVGLHVRVGLVDRGSQKRGLFGVLPSTMPRYEFYSMSVDVELVWEVLLSPHPSLDDFGQWADRNDGWLTRIWPSPGHDVHWPPNRISPVQLEQHRASLLANRNLRDPLPPPVHRTFTVPPDSTGTGPQGD